MGSYRWGNIFGGFVANAHQKLLDSGKSDTGIIAEGIAADKNQEADYRRLIEVFENPSLQMVSFSITEERYSLTDPKGKYLSSVEKDIESGPDQIIQFML